ncbi:unnamed protein product [Effrenium voratum]|uniref:Uncharacterized protein n=1 Tax=Effrenium voratum TaxID=2562239 RepID=A0AA36MTA4_9DINO|nr:unnamed protein product [Effrenium voratum]CAJ1421172.1 unnamed protein product [Effrenium voratum]
MAPLWCSSCKRDIQDAYLRFDGQVFHHECLTCQSCGVAVQRLHKKDGKRLCQNCSLDRCSQCQAPVKDGGIFEGQPWCKKCFVCASCKCFLTSAFTTREHPGRLLCKGCLGHQCDACGLDIDGKSMRFEGQRFCMSCFVCGCCSKPFINGEVYKQDGLKKCGRCVGAAVETPSLEPVQPTTSSRRRLAVKAAKDEKTEWQWNGGYLERGRHAGRPLFVRDCSDGLIEFYIYYHPGFSRWFFGKDVCSEAQVSFACRSLTDAASPELCTWDAACVQEIAEKTESAAWDQKGLFRDRDFPHRLVPSIDGPNCPSSGVEELMWVPARLLTKRRLLDLDTKLMGSGSLLATFSALAECPRLLHKVFKLDDFSGDGRYALELFDHKQKKAVDVLVDEYIPCAPVHWWEDTAEPIFSQPRGNAPWCLLLEKALAKLFGSYAMLQTAAPAAVWRAITGCEQLIAWNRDGFTWQRAELSVEHLNRFGCTKREMADLDQLWAVLCKHQQQSHIMGVSVDGNDERADGLAEGHLYSLLFCVEVPSQRGQLRLLMLRNPWGKSKEWNGRWSDKHPIWAKHPEVRAQLRPYFADDGLFWMQWEDFASTFDILHICPKAAAKEATRSCQARVQDISLEATHAEAQIAKVQVQVQAKPKADERSQGTESGGPQFFSLDKASRAESGTESCGTQSLGVQSAQSGPQVFHMETGKELGHPTLLSHDGKVTEPHKKEGTESNGPQVFSLGENDKKQWRHAQKS